MLTTMMFLFVMYAYSLQYFASSACPYTYSIVPNDRGLVYRPKWGSVWLIRPTQRLECWYTLFFIVNDENTLFTCCSIHFTTWWPLFYSRASISYKTSMLEHDMLVEIALCAIVVAFTSFSERREQVNLPVDFYVNMYWGFKTFRYNALLNYNSNSWRHCYGISYMKQYQSRYAIEEKQNFEDWSFLEIPFQV
jgi:hypothetical protein